MVHVVWCESITSDVWCGVSHPVWRGRARSWPPPVPAPATCEIEMLCQHRTSASMRPATYVCGGRAGSNMDSLTHPSPTMLIATMPACTTSSITSHTTSHITYHITYHIIYHITYHTHLVVQVEFVDVVLVDEQPHESTHAVDVHRLELARLERRAPVVLQ